MVVSHMVCWKIMENPEIHRVFKSASHPFPKREFSSVCHVLLDTGPNYETWSHIWLSLKMGCTEKRITCLRQKGGRTKGVPTTTLYHKQKQVKPQARFCALEPCRRRMHDRLNPGSC